MIHLFEPSRHGRDQSAVHYEAPGGQELLCGHGHVFKEIDGERYRMWAPTKQPITCASCTKRLELLARMQIQGLTAAQLEELLDHIASIRNGHANGTAPDAA